MEIRVAGAREKRAIVAFCKSVDPEDYVPDAIDWFLRNGRFLLLLDGAKIAGIDHFERRPDGSAWLAAARIHPDYRGHGWIVRMNEYALSLPRMRGLNTARMLITADNRSSLRAADKGGYAPAARLTLLEWKAPRTSPRGARASTGFGRATSRQFREAVADNTILRLQGGLLHFPRWMTQVMAPNAGALSWASREGMLFNSPRSGPLVAARVNGWPGLLRMQPSDGTAEGAQAVLSFARERRAKEVSIVLPDADRITSTYIESGFRASDWARHVIIMEKRVGRAGRAISRAGAPAARRRRRR